MEEYISFGSVGIYHGQFVSPLKLHNKLHVCIMVCTGNLCFFIIISEAIQSRCAVLRYSRLTDAQVLHRLLEVCEKEQVGADF